MGHPQLGRHGLHLAGFTRYHKSMTMNTTTPGTTPPETLLPVIAEYIGVKPAFCGGKPYLIGHRIKVQHIAVWRERMGMTPEEIVATYPGLSLPAVFAALAYYHSHRTEINADIEADERLRGRNEGEGGPVQAPRQALRTTWQGRFASTWMRIATRVSPRA